VLEALRIISAAAARISKSCARQCALPATSFEAQA